LERYLTDRATYHVSAEPDKVGAGLPNGQSGSYNIKDLPLLLDDFHAREILHVTFGSALMQFGNEIKSALINHADVYNINLQKHFRKHLDLLK